MAGRGRGLILEAFLKKPNIPKSTRSKDKRSSGLMTPEQFQVHSSSSNHKEQSGLVSVERNSTAAANIFDEIIPSAGSAVIDRANDPDYNCEVQYGGGYTSSDSKPENTATNEETSADNQKESPDTCKSASSMLPEESNQLMKLIRNDTSETNDATSTTLPGANNLLLHKKETPKASKETSSRRGVVCNKTQEAEANWARFKTQRRIDKILKNVSRENLDVVIEEIEKFLEESPLASRFVDESDVRLLLDVILDKGVSSIDFLEFAPCLIKNVCEFDRIEFKKHFPDLAHLKREEVVQVTTSDEIVSPSIENYCRLLGRLLTLPRNTGNSLFKVVADVVTDNVERWTFPDGIEVNVKGHQEVLALVHANSVCKLLDEIEEKVLVADREVEKMMEKYMWLVRESILNGALPRSLREVYLDLYASTQKPEPEPAVVKVVEIVDSNEEADENEDSDEAVIVEGEYPLVEGEEKDITENSQPDPQQEEEITEASPPDPEQGVGGAKDEEVAARDFVENEFLDESRGLPDDQYMCVTQLLKELNMGSQLSRFKDNFIRDTILDSDQTRFKALLKEAGFPAGMIFEIMTYLEDNEVSSIRRKALQNNSKPEDVAKRIQKEKEEVEKLIGDSLVLDGVIKPQVSKNRHSAAAKTTVPADVRIPEISSTDRNRRRSSDNLSERENASVQYSDEAMDQVSSHLESTELEEQSTEYTIQEHRREDSTANSSSHFSPNRAEPSVVPASDNTFDTSFFPRNQQSRGRGRGMVETYVPVANVPPMGRERQQSGTRRQEPNDNWRNQDSRSRHWRRDGNQGNRQFSSNRSSPHRYNGGFQNSRGQKKHQQKYNVRNHPRAPDEDEERSAIDRSKFGGGFVGRMPRKCLRCGSTEHPSDQCSFKMFYD